MTQGWELIITNDRKHQIRSQEEGKTRDKGEHRTDNHEQYTVN